VRFVELVGWLVGEVVMVVAVGLVVGACVGWCQDVSLFASPSRWFCNDRRAMVPMTMVM